MKYTEWIVIALLREIVFLGMVSFTKSQKTYSRQGSGRESPTVLIPGQGTIVGKEISSRTQRVVVFLGIPYAKPPIGQFRFAAPVTDQLPSWSGIRNATRFAPSCQQDLQNRKLHERLFMKLLPMDLPDPGIDEDCLYLNIYMPDGIRPPDGWPVIVWFHSGDFNTGTPAMWDASVFVTKQKLIVITVAYRLNIFGFFTTTDAEAPGNYGMLDQIAALDWIKKNIELFDGSPSNIIIFGHSAGAISVGLHMISPLSRDKFSKAIAISGDAVGSVRSVEAEEPVVEKIADRFGCNRSPTTDLITCLRRLPAAHLLEHSSDIETWGPILDYNTNNSSDPFLPAHPKELLESDSFTALPFITGYTNNEQALAYIETIGNKNQDGKLTLKTFESIITEESVDALKMPDENSTCVVKAQMVTEAVLFFYKPHPPTEDQTVLRDKYLELQTEKNYAAGLIYLAGKVSRQNEDTFVYRFDYRAKTDAVSRDIPKWAGVPHMFELPFLWGLPYSINANIQWNPADKKMADGMMSMIGNFARFGNPSLPTIRWDSYTEENPELLIIKDGRAEMSDSRIINHKAFAFWNDYYPVVLEEATNNCCNMTSGSTSSLSLKFSIYIIKGFTLLLTLKYS